MGFGSFLKKTVGTIGGGIIGGLVGGPAGAVIGAGIGNAYDSSKASSKAQNKQNALAQSQYDQNVALQKEFAQNSMQWRVDDAKKAGLHPMAALGIQGSSFYPVQTVNYAGYGDNTASNLMNAISDMGQSVNYASTKGKDSQQQQVAVRLAQEGVELQNEGLRLDNEYKRWQLLQAMETGTSQSLRSPAAPATTENRLIAGQGNSPAPVRKADTVDSGESKYQFLRQPNGSYSLVPGNDWSQVYEDKGILLESWPIVNTMVTDYAGRASGEVIDGMVYSNALHGWVPVDSKEGRAAQSDFSSRFRRGISDTIDFYSRLSR